MKIKKFGHLAFNCKDQKKSVAFYRDILGCSEKFSLTYGDMAESVREGAKARGIKIPEFIIKMLAKDKDRVWITYLELADGEYIELFDQKGARKKRVPNHTHLNYQHFSLIVEDIHALKEELIAKGVAIDTDISLGIDNTYQMWIHDPDGNKIEFMQYTDSSMQIIGR